MLDSQLSNESFPKSLRLPVSQAIARFPGGDTLAHTTVLAVEVLCTAGEAGGHGDTGLIEGGLGDIAQEGLIEGLQGLLGIGEHVPSGGLAFVDTEVVITIDQRARQSAEEDANLKRERPSYASVR